MSDSTDATGTDNILGSIFQSALTFATPFAQKALGVSSTPQQTANQTLKDAALNGSGPADPTLANQSPLGLWDFITGSRLSGQSPSNAGQGGLFSGNQSGLTFIGVIAIAVIAVFVVLRR